MSVGKHSALGDVLKVTQAITFPWLDDLLQSKKHSEMREGVFFVVVPKCTWKNGSEGEGEGNTGESGSEGEEESSEEVIEIAFGKCGENVYWSYFNNGKLKNGALGK